MKSIYLIVPVIILILVCLISCAEISLPQESLQEEEESLVDLSLSISHENCDNETVMDNYFAMIYNPYYLLSPTDPFVFSMQDNPIDQWARVIMQERLTTQDMYNGLLLIYERWINELSATEHALQSVLEDTELKDKLLDYQNAWMEYVEKDIQFDKLVLTDGEWATEFQLVFLERRIDLYRARTIQLKYLIYMYCDYENNLETLWFLDTE